MELTQAILLTTEVSLKAGEGKPNTGMDLVDILQEFVDISNEVELGKVDYKSVSEALARCQGQRRLATLPAARRVRRSPATVAPDAGGARCPPRYPQARRTVIFGATHMLCNHLPERFLARRLPWRWKDSEAAELDSTPASPHLASI